ncbi:hypothetical protein LR961_11550 [Stenotrophomonas sp. SY1]|nr:hypothetical protein [Stenotrophomonas sp. SY1]
MSRWETYNPITHCIETPDGTVVAAEIIDSIECLADLFYVMQIRSEQRKQMPVNNGAGGE